MKPAKTAQNWIWRITKRDFVAILLLSLISGLTSGGMVLFALITQNVIDTATGKQEGSLWVHGILLIGLVIAEGLLTILFNYLKSWTFGRIEIRVKDLVFSSLFQKKWKDISGFHSGELLNRIVSDNHVVVTAVVTLIPQLVAMITKLVACIAVMFSIDWRFTVAILAIGLIMLLVSRLYGQKMKNIHKICQETDGQGKAFKQESISNWMVIQSFGGLNHIRERLRRYLIRHYRAKLRRVKWMNVGQGAMYFLFSGSYYAALLWGAVMLSLQAITFGELTAFLQIVSQIRTPFMNMSGILPQYYNMLASAERIMEIENLPDEPRLPQLYEAGELYGRMESLRVDNVSFAYDEEKIVLDGADFTVRKGEFVALAGFSGIGKTTLFKLMLGFYPPDTGALYAQLGEEKVTLGADTRCLFAYVPQQSMLLSGTIRENIAFCCGDVSDEAIWAAAEVADVADAIRQQPEGLDTVLGERGSGLSEGQLQRLAIARAVLSDAPILLLDECTASLDEATEERVLQRLRALPDRTCLCISHRPAALEICDRVVRVVDGKFVED
ncbi:MAG: ABC transporter ATP-binding protein [Clostridia bacterium]|nr:ABC transporter ATP-binding protein [Clostridia bacterium]